MRIHYFQHESHEGLGCIEDWSKRKEHSLTSTKFYEDAKLPDLSTFDFLIIMGGSMGVNDEDKYKWLMSEKNFIKKTIDSKKPVLGICLGSQLIAASLGARVYQNKYKEIGWMNIDMTNDAQDNFLFTLFPQKLKVCQWHGDTFDLPDGAILLAESEGCKNQAFIYNKHVLGLQFHLEFTEESLKELINFGREELVENKYVQTEKEILQNLKLCNAANNYLFQILDRIEESII